MSAATPSRVVAITGGSAGIGRALALRVARDGAAVVICARRADKLAQAAHEIEQAGGRVLAIAADVTDGESMQRMVAETIARFGRLDVIVCNAGFGIYGAIDTIDPLQMQRQLDVNYMGTYHAIRAALPYFRERQHGHIIVISSIVGRRGIPFTGAYAATKFAQIGLAESLRAGAWLLGLLTGDPVAWFKGDLSAKPAAVASLSADPTPGSNEDAEIDRLVAQRDALRRDRNFKEADRIRQELAARGIAIEDVAGGSARWRRTR